MKRNEVINLAILFAPGNCRFTAPIIVMHFFHFLSVILSVQLVHAFL